MTDSHDLIRRGDAVKSLRDWQDSLNKQRMPDTAIAIGMAADLVATLPSVGVTVKPLEWVETSTGSSRKGEVYHARSLVDFAPLAVHKKHDGWWLNVDCKTYSDIDAAKAAAQADYAARILSSLDVQPAPDAAQVRAKALREAANVDWSHGTDVLDKAPEFLTPWQRGLVAGQQAMRGAILALIDTPTPAPSPDVALRDAAQKVVDRFLPTRTDMIFSKRAAIDAIAAALARKGGA